jgi:hypothetical protein
MTPMFACYLRKYAEEMWYPWCGVSGHISKNLSIQADQVEHTIEYVQAINIWPVFGNVGNGKARKLNLEVCTT